MEPTHRILTNQSTKSYLQREFVTSIDDGPMVGNTLELIATRDHDSNEHDNDHSRCTTALEKPVSYNGKETSIISADQQKKKKGLLRLICMDSDITSNPREFSKFKKNTILLLVAIGGAISPVSSTVYYPALVTMQTYFQTDATTMNASISIFTFFTAFFPLIWATFGDLYGRRRIYIISFFITVVGSIGCALSVNIVMFIVFRAISAAGSSSAMSMGAGTISDIFEPHERGKAFAIYTAGPLLGPAIGPIVGGYLNQGLGWRSNFWFLVIFSALVWIGIIVALPETWRPGTINYNNTKAIIDQSPLAPLDNPAHSTTSTEVTHNEKTPSIATIPQKEEEAEESKTVNENDPTVTAVKKKKKMINPIGALTLLLYPNIALTVTFVGVLFFVLYVNSTNFTRIYGSVYGFDSGTIGLCYLPSAAGLIIGGTIGGRSSDAVYNKRVANARAIDQPIHPEMRIGGVVFYGSVVLQLAAFIAYGWCIQEKVHFAAGLVFQFLLGIGLMAPNVALSAYMVDCFRKKGASVTACNNFARYICAGIGSLLSSNMYDSLGAGVTFTLCGCFLFIASGALIVLKMNTDKWIALREHASQ